MLVQLNKCVVCGSVLQSGHSGDWCLSLSLLFKYECRLGHLFVLSLAMVRWVGLVECCFGIMYVEWYGICNFVVISAVDVCADYGGVYVFHVCFYLCVVYGNNF